MLDLEHPVKEEKQSFNKDEYAIYSKQVRSQPGDIYKVTSKGVTVDYTNRISEALSSFKDAVGPKEMWKLPTEGGAVLMKKV